LLPVSRLKAPTRVIPLIALAPDIKGVCKVLGILDISSNPRKIAKTNMKKSNKKISIT
jgi:hypothetical protein